MDCYCAGQVSSVAKTSKREAAEIRNKNSRDFGLDGVEMYKTNDH